MIFRSSLIAALILLTSAASAQERLRVSPGLHKEDDRALEVMGFFGKPKRVTKVDFIRIWVEHAQQLTSIGINVVDQVRDAAAADFEETWKRRNPS